MDIDFATTLAYLGFGVLVLLAAGTGLRKDLKNVAGAFVFGSVGLMAAAIVAIPVHQLGVQGVVDATIAWQHAMPLVGWLLIGAFVVGLAAPVPCALRAVSLVRAGAAERRDLCARVTARLARLRRDIRDSH